MDCECVKNAQNANLRATLDKRDVNIAYWVKVERDAASHDQHGRFEVNCLFISIFEYKIDERKVHQRQDAHEGKSCFLRDHRLIVFARGFVIIIKLGADLIHLHQTEIDQIVVVQASVKFWELVVPDCA